MYVVKIILPQIFTYKITAFRYKITTYNLPNWPTKYVNSKDRKIWQNERLFKSGFFKRLLKSARKRNFCLSARSVAVCKKWGKRPTREQPLNSQASFMIILYVLFMKIVLFVVFLVGSFPHLFYRMRENTDQKNSEYWHFSHGEFLPQNFFTAETSIFTTDTLKGNYQCRKLSMTLFL